MRGISSIGGGIIEKKSSIVNRAKINTTPSNDVVRTSDASLSASQEKRGWQEHTAIPPKREAIGGLGW